MQFLCFKVWNSKIFWYFLNFNVFEYPIKENQAGFFFTLPRRYIIFGHFLSLFDFLEVFLI